MKQLQLPEGNKAVVPYVGPRPMPTHLVDFWWRRNHLHDDDELIGRMSCAWNDSVDQRRIVRLKSRLYRTLEVDWHRLRVDVRPIGSADERRTLSDLQRFRRKMGMVLRAYEEEKAAIANGQRGLPEIALEQLEHDLAASWTKAHKIYGHTKEDFYNEQ